MAEKIDPQLVRHIGHLSRIELSGPEVDTFCAQLADIISYFDKLRELDTEGVAPMPHAVELQDVLADDEPVESLPRDRALDNAPDTDGKFFKAPRVLGEQS